MLAIKSCISYHYVHRVFIKHRQHNVLAITHWPSLGKLITILYGYVDNSSNCSPSPLASIDLGAIKHPTDLDNKLNNNVVFYYSNTFRLAFKNLCLQI